MLGMRRPLQRAAFVMFAALLRKCHIRTPGEMRSSLVQAYHKGVDTGGHGEPPEEDDIMTRQKTYMLTAISAALYVLLTWIFSDGMFSTPLWSSDAIAASPIWTYVLLATIIGLGSYQASQIPEEGVVIQQDPYTSTKGQVDDPVFWKLLLGNSYYALLWLPIRFFVGMDWLAAGEHKLRDDAWMNGGTALKGYWTSATTVPEGAQASKAAGTVGWFND